jgi:hypothetical protein
LVRQFYVLLGQSRVLIRPILQCQLNTMKLIPHLIDLYRRCPGAVASFLTLQIDKFASEMRSVSYENCESTKTLLRIAFLQ